MSPPLRSILSGATTLMGIVLLQKLPLTGMVFIFIGLLNAPYTRQHLDTNGIVTRVTPQLYAIGIVVLIVEVLTTL